MTNVISIRPHPDPGETAPLLSIRADLLTFTFQAETTLEIVWRGDPGVESFQAFFGTPTQKETWGKELQDALQAFHMAKYGPEKADDGPSRSPWMKTLDPSDLVNPYSGVDDGEDEDNDDDEHMEENPGGSHLRRHTLSFPQPSPHNATQHRDASRISRNVLDKDQPMI